MHHNPPMPAAYAELHAAAERAEKARASVLNMGQAIQPGLTVAANACGPVASGAYSIEQRITQAIEARRNAVNPPKTDIQLLSEKVEQLAVNSSIALEVMMDEVQTLQNQIVQMLQAHNGVINRIDALSQELVRASTALPQPKKRGTRK